TFALALGAFALGAGFSERALDPLGTPAGIVERVYFVAGLFVLGGLDLGIPTGPNPARALLWVVYFLAPAITGGALVEGGLRLLRPDLWVRYRLRDHFVVIGAGRLGHLFLEALLVKEGVRQRECPVVVVDAEGNDDLAGELRRRFGAHFIRADIRKPATHQMLALGRARGVVVLTSDDLANLEAAAAMQDQHPGLPVLAHVADLELRRELDALRGTARTFNAHRLAAQRLFDVALRQHLASTEAKDVIVLAGFGRFGQTLYEELLSHGDLCSEIHEVVVVDRHATLRSRYFAPHVPLNCAVPHHCIDGDVADPETWERLRAYVGDAVPPFIVLGTDDDTLNLRVALGLRRREGPEPRIVARVFHASSFTDAVGRRFSLDVLAVEELMRDAIAEHEDDWFPARRPSMLPPAPTADALGARSGPPR
ncbi:MAG: NAD-binding protein, partial [Myxococcota bacterium]